MSDKTDLDTLIEAAFISQGATGDVNKVYLGLLKTDLFVPVQIHHDAGPEDEPYTPLFSTEGDFIFMAAFDSAERLKQWAGEEASNIDYASMKGRDLIAGVGNNVFLALNPGFSFYKEFSPEEIQRLKTIVTKIDSLATKS